MTESYNNFIKQRSQRQETIDNSQGALNGIIALYEVTKEISKSLNESDVFAIFKEQLSRFVDFKDLLFISDKQILEYKDEYALYPVSIGTENFSHIAIKGLSEQDKDMLTVLVNQFAMCLRRINLYKSLQELAITDSLTGTFSRRYCLERLKEEIDRSAKFNLNFSILMIDIDHFKKYNDSFGHLVGDVILKDLSSIIKESIRSVDLVGRFGGEEFLVILPQTTKDATLITASRIQNSILNRHISAYDETLTITVSIGCSSFPDDSRELTELIDRADFALYRAKKTGRNKVCTYSKKE